MKKTILLTLILVTLLFSCKENQVIDDQLKASPVKWENGTVKRDYTSMNNQAITDELKKYDLERPFINISPLDGGKYLVAAGLRDRKWERTMTVAEYSNLKKAGLVFIGVISGAILAIILCFSKGWIAGRLNIPRFW